MKSSQKPKTALASTSRMAYRIISVSTLTVREPSANPQMLEKNRLAFFSCNLFELSLHRIEGPENQGESTNSGKKSAGLGVLRLSHSTSINGQLVDDHEVGNACNTVVSPLVITVVGQGSEETGQNHDNIGNDGNENIATRQAGQESEIQQQ